MQDERIRLSVIPTADWAQKAAVGSWERQEVNKSIRGMPRRQVPKKDVVHCEKRW